MKYVVIILTGVTLLIAGCASSGTATCQISDQTVAQAKVRPLPTSALLFDDSPGYYHAENFVGRSHWPSTDGYYTPSQVVHFRERMVDYQGRGLHHQDWSYRRFNSTREGVSY